jgi:mannose-6-phosphate isomerase-like protein (cupin superfamily)
VFIKSILPAVVLGFFALSIGAADQPASADHGAGALYLTQQQLAAKLQAAISAASDPALSPIGVTDQYSINEVHRAKAGAPAVHAGWTELHFIVSGSATFVTGGTLTPASGGPGSVLQGGVSKKVSKGDAILVPSNTPHWYKEVNGLTYLEVRFLNPPPAGDAHQAQPVR